LEGSNNTAIVAGINGRSTISRKLGVCIHKSAARLAITHNNMVQNIQHILLLREKQAVTLARDTNTQKMMQQPHINHGELTMERSDDSLKKSRRGSTEHNIISIVEETPCQLHGNI
jgi:hypothetical protein